MGNFGYFYNSYGCGKVGMRGWKWGDVGQNTRGARGRRRKRRSGGRFGMRGTRCKCGGKLVGSWDGGARRR